MWHSIKVHKVIYSHPYVCGYIHPSSLWIRYFKNPSPRVKCSPVSVRLWIIYHDIFLGLYTNQHFLRRCLEWFLDLFFGSCVKKCQQSSSRCPQSWLLQPFAPQRLNVRSHGPRTPPVLAAWVGARWWKGWPETQMWRRNVHSYRLFVVKTFESNVWV
jgi:hypothetical protein